MIFLKIAQAPRRFLDLRALSAEYTRKRPAGTRGKKTHRHTQETLLCVSYSKETHTYSKETCQIIFWNGDRALNVNKRPIQTQNRPVKPFSEMGTGRCCTYTALFSSTASNMAHILHTFKQIYIPTHAYIHIFMCQMSMTHKHTNIFTRTCMYASIYISFIDDMHICTHTASSSSTAFNMAHILHTCIQICIPAHVYIHIFMCQMSITLMNTNMYTHIRIYTLLPTWRKFSKQVNKHVYARIYIYRYVLD